MTETEADLQFVVDIEPTNRCNAKCHFCPRDATPHQGLMSMEVYEHALGRAAELRQLFNVKVNLCGLGEPLLNRATPDMVRRASEEGFSCGMSSNASLLDEKKATALLDGGLERIFINVGDVDDDYEEVYRLPFEKTRDNVVRFAEMAKGSCDVYIVLVNYRQDRNHVEAMRAYWQGFGMEAFMEFEVMNRGGALFVDHMQYAQYPERAEAIQMLQEKAGEHALCSVPFSDCFVGYDGNYYLCCSDWKKEAPVGSVMDSSPYDVMEQKLVHVMTGEPVCKTCNLDLINRMTDMLRDVEAGDATVEERDQLLDGLAASSNNLLEGLDKLRPGMPARAAATARQQHKAKKLIPLTTT